MPMTTTDISKALGLPLPAFPANLEYITTDTRQISFPAETLFIAIISPQRNGHAYIRNAYSKGVRHFLVMEKQDKENFPEAVFYETPDTLRALQQMAAFHRNQFNIPVIGITGSNGKTIVKEWLNQMLSPDFNICRSPRSYNSQIGVPLSIWQLDKSYTLGIFEAGISLAGEMENLQHIIRPTIGIFTNLGTAHEEGFSSKEEKLTEKWKLFIDCKHIICCTDDPLIRQMAEKNKGKIISWGRRKDAAYRITDIGQKGTATTLALMHDGFEHTFNIPFTDQASIENTIHCIVTCLHLGLSAEVLDKRINGLHALHMRLEWKKGVFGSLILNDSYSYDLTSLEIALNHLQQQAGNGKMMAVLSDLPGTPSNKAYSDVAALLAQKRISRLIAVGEKIQPFITLFETAGIDTEWYPDTNTLLEKANRKQFEKATILIKGARVFEFEKIAAALQQQQHETVLEINLSALANNLKAYRAILNPGTKMMVMLKAFGYGSTDAELGRWLQHHGADYLAVAYADEGVALREGGVQLPIMVMNPEPGAFEQIIQHNLEPELYCFDILKAFDAYLSDVGLTQYPVHIKLDTGMHRLGFLPEETGELGKLLAKSETMRVVSVFTHLVASENPVHDHFTKEQGTIFEEATQSLARQLPYPFIRHACNTAGILRHPELHFDMVRLGIGLFGASNASAEKLRLQAVSRLLTTVAQVKKVKAGQSVGYGRQAILSRDSLIATVRIGYADGYRRQLGNGTGTMYVNGMHAPVVGNVCMDMTMLDVTDVPGVQAGHRVEVFGEHITVSQIARQSGTIPYEIMTGISQRVKRVLVEE